jgi:hypothetical protein
MEFTDVNIRCYSVPSNTIGNVYRIEMDIKVAGELPRNDIFVYQINAPDDANSDVFSHIATVADLQSLPNDRDKAIHDKTSYYASRYLERIYNDLETAIAAKATLISRVNDLVNTWVRYRDTFSIFSAESVFLPTATEATVELRKNIYVEAKNERIAAEQEVLETTATYEDAVATLSRDEATLAIYVDQKAFLDSVASIEFQAYVALVIADGEGSAATTYRSTILEPHITTARAMNTSQVMSWTNQCASDRQEINRALIKKIEAATVLTAAQKKEDEALAALWEVAPDFDLSSV